MNYFIIATNIKSMAYLGGEPACHGLPIGAKNLHKFASRAIKIYVSVNKKKLQLLGTDPMTLPFLKF